MSNEKATETNDVTVDAQAQALAAIALQAANAEGRSGGVEDGSGETPAVNNDEADNEVVVTIGDGTPPQEEVELEQAPTWVKELRKTNREQARRIRELEKQTTDKEQAKVAITLGPKPKMSDPSIDYDASKFEDELAKWNDQKRAADNEVAQRQAAEKKAQDAWSAKLNEYGAAKSKLKVSDFAEAEATALDSLAQVQQGIVVQGAENPALVIYALGKNSAKLKELSSITDPVKFAFAVAKLERDLKVTTRKAPPPPERTVSGSAPKSGVVDSHLERLRTDAEKSGDFSKVVAYKRQKRAAS